MGSSYFPKPLDNDVVGAVAILVLRIRSPVIHIHISKTTHEQLLRTRRHHCLPFWNESENYSTSEVSKTHLKLILIKDLDQILWDQLKESLNIET